MSDLIARLEALKVIPVIALQDAKQAAPSPACWSRTACPPPR